MMQESTLHKTLKDLYTFPGALQEVEIDGFLIDVVHDQHLLEIQTSNFSALKSKLGNLLDLHRLRLVHPVPQEKWIINLPKIGNTPKSRRKSPKRGRVEDVFSQLVYITDFIAHPNFSLEVLITKQEEIRREDGLGSWRRKGVSIIDHRLLEVVGKRIFDAPFEYLSVLPPTLPDLFTTRDLSSELSIRLRLAGKMVYTLREMGLLAVSGKSRQAWLYRRVE